MARKEIELRIQDRTNLLTFKIREMPAHQLETWLMRASLALGKTGGIEELLRREALTPEALAGMISRVDFDQAKPLLDEMLACCARVDGGVEQPCTQEGFIDDVRTLLKLRLEALKLNLGFLLGVVPLSSPGDAPFTLKVGRPGKDRPEA